KFLSFFSFTHLLPLLLFENTTQNLTRWIPGNRINEFDLVYILIGCKLVINPLHQFTVRLLFVTSSKNHVSFWHFSGFLICLSDDCYIVNSGKTEHQYLSLPTDY